MKQERGSIVLYVLIMIIFFIFVLAAIYMNYSSKTIAQNQQIKQIEENYDRYNSENKLDRLYVSSLQEESITDPVGAMPENVEIIDFDYDNGIVIRDNNQNEWVWVIVPKNVVFQTATYSTDYENIEKDLSDYATSYRNGAQNQAFNWTDEWYDGEGNNLEDSSNLEDTTGCGLTYLQYNQMYKDMLKSIYTYGGFWIARYEAGIEGTDTARTTGKTAHTDLGENYKKAVSKKDTISYNWLYCSEAQTLAGEMTPNDNYTSSLMYGIQWDLTCKYIEEYGNLTYENIAGQSDGIGSKNWGNFSDSEFQVTNLNAKTANAYNSFFGTKSEESMYLFTSGASEINKVMNIYDFAGNDWEWTLEHATSTLSSPCAFRGGNFSHAGAQTPCAYRTSYSSTTTNFVGFRPTFFNKSSDI